MIRTKLKELGFSALFIAMVVIGLALTIYIGYRASASDKKLFSVSLLPLFAGLLFECFRVSDSWKTVIGLFIGTYFFSLFNFLPRKNEISYNFESHIETWPYYFIFFFSLAFIIIYKDKVTAKLTEGITLLQSLAIIYWVIDYGFTNYDNWLAIILLSIVFIFSIFSFLNALTYLKLSNTIRLILSVWSNIIMLAFAADNIFRVLNNPDIENANASEGFNIALQYFLLGVSIVYIMQNFILLVGFLPSKNGNYQKELQENKEEHLNRYSEKQVMITHSLLCILYCALMFGVNYYHQILPRHTMIWLVFLTFPLILQLKNISMGRRQYN